MSHIMGHSVSHEMYIKIFTVVRIEIESFASPLFLPLLAPLSALNAEKQ